MTASGRLELETALLAAGAIGERKMIAKLMIVGLAGFSSRPIRLKAGRIKARRWVRFAPSDGRNTVLTDGPAQTLNWAKEAILSLPGAGSAVLTPSNGRRPSAYVISFTMRENGVDFAHC